MNLTPGNIIKVVLRAGDRVTVLNDPTAGEAVMRVVQGAGLPPGTVKSVVGIASITAKDTGLVEVEGLRGSSSVTVTGVRGGLVPIVQMLEGETSDDYLSAPGACTLVNSEGMKVATSEGFQDVSLPAPVGFQITAVSSTVIRLALTDGSGVTRYEDVTLTNILDDAPPAPDLASISQYQDPQNARAYLNVPYLEEGKAQESWIEAADAGRTHRQEFDIEVPPGTPPVGGWPSLGHFHPSGGNKTQLGGLAAVKTLCLSMGIAFWSASFRNPNTNYNWDGLGSIPTKDPALVIQRVRSLSSALSLSTEHIAIVCRSKGNSAILAAYMGDNMNPAGTTHASRQSSLPSFIWGLNTQVFYSSARWGAAFVPPANLAAFLAAEPDIPGIPNTVDYVASAVAANRMIPTVTVHEGGQYVGAPHIDAVTDIHWRDNGLVLANAFAAANASHLIAAITDAQGEDQHGDLLATWAHVRAGVPLREALAMARARRRGASLGYLRSDGSGVAANSDGSGTVALGGVIGAIVDGSYGIANRANVATAQGYGFGQPTASTKPTMQAGANGNFVVKFDGTNDKLASPYVSDGTPNLLVFTKDGMLVTTYISATTTQVLFGVGTTATTLANKEACVMVVQDANVTLDDIYCYGLWAKQIGGSTYTNVLT